MTTNSPLERLLIITPSENVRSDGKPSYELTTSEAFTFADALHLKQQIEQALEKVESNKKLIDEYCRCNFELGRENEELKKALKNTTDLGNDHAKESYRLTKLVDEIREKHLGCICADLKQLLEKQNEM